MTINIQLKDNPTHPQADTFIGLPTLMQLAVSGEDLAPMGRQLLEQIGRASCRERV